MPGVADWLSVQEAAVRCGVTYRTIYRMVCEVGSWRRRSPTAVPTA
jgi:hypothetical protein